MLRRTRGIAVLRAPPVSRQSIPPNISRSRFILKPNVLGMLQAASVVTISRIGDPTVPNSDTNVHYSLLDHETINDEDVKQIAFVFGHDGERAGITCASTFPKSNVNVLEALLSYSRRLHQDEYAKVFHRTTLDLAMAELASGAGFMPDDRTWHHAQALARKEREDRAGEGGNN